MNLTPEVAGRPHREPDSALADADRAVYDLLQRQRQQERTTLKLIASENFAPSAVLEAVGSIFTNKYAEGYPGARYYEGNETVDKLERLAIERLKSLFGCEHANVQPYSGSPANQAVYRALLEPGDKVMGLSLPAGGHLTHGWPASFSGIDYRSVPYGLDARTQRIDYDRLRQTALSERPKLIWVGGTAYPRIFDFATLAAIASEVDAYLVADIAHINALIIAGVHPSPIPHCDVVTSTSHKALRGPRGGFILSRREDRYQRLYHARSPHDLAKRIDRAVFPQLQGGPHMNVVAALAVALKEAATPAFRAYGRQIAKNAAALAEALLARGYDLVTGGTDNHLLVMDLRTHPLSGKDYARRLAQAGIITNFNLVPADPRRPAVTSGLRLGTPAVTSMGMKEADMKEIAGFIDAVCQRPADAALCARVRRQVGAFCAGFSIPGITG